MTGDRDWESEGGKGHLTILDEDRVAAALPRSPGGTSSSSSRGCASRRQSIGSCLCVKHGGAAHQRRKAERFRFGAADADNAKEEGSGILDLLQHEAIS